jgi:flavin-dependent dehydrogenase
VSFDPRGIFFAGDSAGHCLPLTAEGIRTALYFGVVLGRELRGVVEGRQNVEEAARRHGSFDEGRRWKFRCLFLVQKALPLVPPRLLALVFRHYLAIAPPPSREIG